MTQPTPGPYRVHVEGDKTGVLTADNVTHLATFYGQRKAANAQLYAASPDLLAELDRSLAWIAKVAADHDGDGTGLSERAMKQFDRNIAAIAKAKGA